MSLPNMPDAKSFDRMVRQACDALPDTILNWAEFVRADSPIETLLATGLFAQMAVGQCVQTHITWVRPSDGLVVADAPPVNRFGWSLFIEPQKVIEGVRVDFLISTQCCNMSGDGPQTWARLIVECDGHNFHERTKDQAARDRSRDRRFQENGYTVFRFTGAEIYSKAWECSYQIMKWAYDKAWK